PIGGSPNRRGVTLCAAPRHQSEGGLMSRFIATSTAAVAVAVVLALGGYAWAQAPGPWEAPAGEKGKKSPGGNAANGKKLADVNCVSCHGPSGKGDGPAAAALTPKPADWTSAKVQKET